MWELDSKKGWMPKNGCLQTVYWRRLLRVPWTARRSNQSILNVINLNIHWKDWGWSFNTLAAWCKEPTHWKRPRCWERLKAGEGGDRGPDGWMTSLTQWTWVWASSRRWWRTGKPGILQSTVLQRVSDWTEQNTGTTHVSSRILFSNRKEELLIHAEDWVNLNRAE